VNESNRVNGSHNVTTSKKPMSHPNENMQAAAPASPAAQLPKQNRPIDLDRKARMKYRLTIART
jgi:hypothetical protein